jgi:two-component system phosphate regulon response regulator PhoB
MTTPAKILIVDDEPAIRDMVGFALARRGFEYIEAADAEEAQARIAADEPDLVVLDWMLPGRSGFDFAKLLKRNPDTRDLPIIMLTARGDERDKVMSLDAGADDYVTKPFSPAELLARIRAVLRRRIKTTTSGLHEFNGLQLDPLGHRVSAGEKLLDMGPTEFRLLRFFLTHPERVYSRTQLIDLVWGDNVYVGERAVDVHIRRLRQALEPSGHDRLIQTVRGVGYRLSRHQKPQ